MQWPAFLSHASEARHCRGIAWVHKAALLLGHDHLKLAHIPQPRGLPHRPSQACLCIPAQACHVADLPHLEVIWCLEVMKNACMCTVHHIRVTSALIAAGVRNSACACALTLGLHAQPPNVQCAPHQGSKFRSAPFPSWSRW